MNLIIVEILLLNMIFWIIIFFICHLLMHLLVKRSIEKRYGKKLQFDSKFHIYFYGGGRTKAMALAQYLLLNYLDKKNIIKNEKYNIYLNPLLKISYNIKSETKLNLFISLMFNLSMIFTAISVFILVLLAFLTK